MRKVGGKGLGGGGGGGEVKHASRNCTQSLDQKINKKSTTFMKESLKQEHRHITIRFYFLFLQSLAQE